MPLIAPSPIATSSAKMMLRYSGIPAWWNRCQMNGVNRYTAPTERSISPRIITNTSPAAMIASGAKYGSSDLKLSPLTKLLVVIAK